MSRDWYVERYVSGEYIDHTPLGMSKEECEQLLGMYGAANTAVNYKIVHKSDLKEPID